MPTTQITLRLADDALELLDKSCHDRERTAYVESLIRQQWRRWQTALDTLRVAGWSRGHILSAMDALNGSHSFGPRSATAVSLGLEDYGASGLRPELYPGDAIMVPDTIDEWEALVAQVRDQPELADALLELAEEWWMAGGGAELARRLCAP